MEQIKFFVFREVAVSFYQYLHGIDIKVDKLEELKKMVQDSDKSELLNGTSAELLLDVLTTSIDFFKS